MEMTSVMHKQMKKFSVYQNPAFSAALAAKSIQPSKYTFISILSASSASAFAFLRLASRENGIVTGNEFSSLSPRVAYMCTKALQIVLGLFFVGTMLALAKFLYLWRRRNIVEPSSSVTSKSDKKEPLTKHQLALLGIKQNVSDVLSKPSKFKPPSSLNLVPLHEGVSNSNSPSRIDLHQSIIGCGKMINCFNTPKSPASPPPTYCFPTSSQYSSIQVSPCLNSSSTPWKSQRANFATAFTENELEKFLADVDEKIIDSAGKTTTPSPSLKGFSSSSPNTILSSPGTSGTKRNTPLRQVRMSPGSQKFGTPPKKGEGELPPPMSIEEFAEACEKLGIYSQIENWRDRMRQWFSSVLLHPLVKKIDTSHIQVMHTAAKLGVSVAINKVGSHVLSNQVPAFPAGSDRTNEWQLATTFDEDSFLHDLRASLVQARDTSISTLSSANAQQHLQQGLFAPTLQECINAITEHQKLIAMMKGELIKGILPQSNVRADYMIKRICELAEGTCVKDYQYVRSTEIHENIEKKWILEIPTDTHLLLYLFCAFLEYPGWMLYVDPISHTDAQYSSNPLFLGMLPPKEKLPEMYIAVTSNVPSILHSGACVLVIGRQSVPLFALYWDKKLQFSLQGRSALWDSILLVCHQIKVEYGGIVRGLHLGSSSLSILPLLTHF